MTHQMSRSSTRMSRSPSKSRSRSSDKFLDSSTSDDSRLSTPKFRMTTKSPSPSPRRASAAHLTTTGSSSRSNSRSRSLRSKRHSTHISHSLSGTHLASLSPRTSIAHSLSVPDGEDGEFHLVRNFSVTSKGVINRGDSFRCKSRSTSLCSTPTSPGSEESFPAFSNNNNNNNNNNCASTSSVSPVPVAAAAAASPAEQQHPPSDVPKYTVWLMGTNGVGKTSIRNQFMTSEYICQYDNWQDETQNKTVMVSLDGIESELEIVECATFDDKIRSKDSLPDAFIIVYSVTNRRSYIQARQIVSKLETSFGSRAAILVGNKTDLARLRTVTTVEGRSLAKERGIKYIETSVAINHQLDELLVGVVTQIRIKAKIAEKQRKRNNDGTRSKATCIIKRLWRRTCITSKSCDNLHAL